MRIPVLLSMVALTAACGAQKTVLPQDVGMEQAVTLCDVIDNRAKYIGTTIRVSVDYVADGTSYAFVRDPACGPGGVITGNIEGDSGDVSYDAFMNERNDYCRESSESNVCVVDARIDATIEFKPDSEGVLSAFIRRIHSTRIGVD